ncbi:hypothetical protein [Loktanella sp. M215]|uniref:hypothetical protein n=1 Tax=Loktanella sp. M215 TaxID=2675431 RepID=UPI001F249D2B|nr:hypothetical protein [Loktanella sp. M215]MCF7699915.1 hypothetical protein [Loktanella sp. M215]
MHINDADYPDGQPSNEVKLKALGFDASGHRGGGIERPQVKVLPTNTVLLRFHNPVLKVGDLPGDFGAWWFTPFELSRICDYFGVNGSALIVDRSSGKSALHGILALLREWYEGSPTQLSYVNAVRLKDPFLVCYGEGAPANTQGYARTLKPIKLGGSRPARQIYIHNCWNYQASMDRLLAPNTSTDAVFGSGAGLPARITQAPRLSFEV